MSIRHFADRHARTLHASLHALRPSSTVEFSLGRNVMAGNLHFIYVRMEKAAISNAHMKLQKEIIKRTFGISRENSFVSIVKVRGLGTLQPPARTTYFIGV